MLRRKRTLLIVLLVALMMLPMGGMAVHGQDAETKDLVIGDVFIVATGLGPPGIGTFFSFRVTHAAYDSLTGWDALAIAAGEQPEPVPDLAESWEVSDDGLVYTFKLRPDILFSTGRPLTAESVKGSFERAIAVIANIGLASQFPWTDQIASIEVLDELTVRFTFSKPYAPFLATISSGFFAIVDLEEVFAHEADGDLGAGWLSYNSAGSGPYTFTEADYQVDQRLVMHRNPYYWGGADGVQPWADRLIFLHVPENATRELMLAGGELDVALYLDPINLRTLEATSPDVTIHTFPSAMTCNMMIDLRIEPLQAGHPKVLQAIRYGIDYEGFLNVLGGGYGTVQQSLILPGMLGYEEETAHYYTYDPDKAKQLLAEAGYPDGFKVTLLSRPGACGAISYPATIEWWQQNLAKIGIEAEIVETTGTNFWGLVHDGEGKLRDFGTSGLGATYFDADQPATMRATYELNQLGWMAVDPEAATRAAELTALGQQTMDPAERHEIYAELSRLMVETGPYLTVVQVDDVVAAAPDVTGIYAVPGHFPIDFKYIAKQ